MRKVLSDAKGAVGKGSIKRLYASTELSAIKVLALGNKGQGGSVEASSGLLAHPQ